jgi:hypothetical protein
MTTSIAKTKTGWQGNTRILIGDNRVLLIQTAKNSYGSLTTTGSVRKVTRDADGLTESYNRHDYHKVWITWDVRATEKQVREQHSKAMAMTYVKIPEVDEHYAVDKG